MKCELFQPVMGSDLSVVNAARVSFAKESSLNADGCLKQADVNLIRYLARGASNLEWLDIIESLTCNDDPSDIEVTVADLMKQAQHWVPFTHTAISLRMSAPVPIRVQCFKHKIGFTESEESRRYISSDPELFIPTEFRMAAKDKKQGSGGAHPNSGEWNARYAMHCLEGIQLYADMIHDGVAPEQARFVLPQGVEVNWIWTGNLASFARYYNQRSDPHAQQESAELAEKVWHVINPFFPVSWGALTTGA